MLLSKPVLALLFCGVLLSCRPALAQYGRGGGGKAKTGLEDATAAAKKWQPDALLTSISAPKADPNGQAPTWFYGFYSAKKDSYLNVTAKNGSFDSIPAGVGKTAPVAAGFMDSDAIMDAAVKAGLKGDSPTMVLNGATWIVTGGQDKGNSIIVLNAKTGHVLKKNEVQ